MDGKRHFRDCCKTLELDCDSLFQLGKCSVPVSGRLRHRFDFQKRKKSQIFAVCYVEKENVYVAWNLKVKKAAKKSIYENEIRANRVIAQLDAVISSLDDIKQNQYMMYQELRKINTSLQQLNSTMDAAVGSLRNIETNTKHISENSDLIAHNTAVTAYYSKVNAELTNALGYMVAFK